MEYPVDAQDAREKLAKGRLIKGLMGSKGYVDLLKPFLLSSLEKADKKCHDIKLREDRGKHAIVEYNTIKNIVDFLQEHIENMEHSAEYLKDHNIKY